MTDTTDIKALSYARLIEVRNILSGFEDGYDTVADRENYEAMRDAQALIDELISARGKLRESNHQLEAERQRADDAHKYGSERDTENESLMLTVGRLRAELAALKGDQVPTGKFAGWGLYRASKDDFGSWLHIKPRDENDHALTQHGYVNVKLFTAPQNPVVLPAYCPHCSYALNPEKAKSDMDAERAAIEAAGSTVIKSNT